MKEKQIEKVLMCEPTYLPYEVPYSINPWMRPGQKIHQKRAFRQWENLASTYQQLGIEVETVKQQKGLPDMVFTADQGIVRDKTVLLSRFLHAERKPETSHYKTWFQNNGFDVKELPSGYYFEGGGEAQFWNDTLFVGHGWRSNESTTKILKNYFSDHKVIPLKITNERFYHLDVGLLPLDNETVLYVPDAFSEKSKKVLKEEIPNLLPLSRSESNNFAANSIVSGEHVVFQKSRAAKNLTKIQNYSFEKKLENLGFEPVGVNVSEFKKLGGGIHCLTNILK